MFGEVSDFNTLYNGIRSLLRLKLLSSKSILCVTFQDILDRSFLRYSLHDLTLSHRRSPGTINSFFVTIINIACDAIPYNCFILNCAFRATCYLSIAIL